jgi:hypothetical protein
MSDPRKATIDEIAEAAVKWISADADHPDTPPKEWQKAFLLMRGAPYLLEACQAVLTRLDLEPRAAIFPGSALRDLVRDAIAKAEGKKREK